MAKQKRKQAKSQPLSSHPLFAAVVALWFGALFGLGSLAVRPSLIEDLVLKSRIDLIIPAAAPPLGVTARIALALFLAAIGAVIGSVLARRLNRPKVEPRERSRSARVMAEAEPRIRARDAHPDAPACTPVSIHDLETGVEPAADTILAGRRRALTVEQGESHFVPQDHAPLPGGAPQVLDFATTVPAPAAPATPFAALDPIAAQAQIAVPPLPSVVPTAPFASVAPAAAIEIPFAAPSAVPAPDAALQPQAAIAPESAAAHADGRQVFGMAPPEPLAEQPRQIFGMAVDADHVPQDFVREAGYQTTVFEQQAPAPLFVRAEEPQTAEPAQAEFGQPAATPPLAVTESSVMPIRAPEPSAEPVTAPLPSFAPVPQAAPAATIAPAPLAEPALPSPSSLGMTDLAARLAESMKRRRAARAGAAAGNQVPDLAAEKPPVLSPAPEAPIAETPLGVPQFAAPAIEPAATAMPAEQVAAPIAVAQPFAAPVDAPDVQPTEAAAPPVMAQPAASLVAAVPDALPNAPRPLALDAFLEEDTDLDSSLLPPRHIALEPAAPAAEPNAPAMPAAFAANPVPVAEPGPAAFVAPAATAPIPVAYEPQTAEPDDGGEEPVAEENYASLLGVATPRAGFVRIDEPEDEIAEPEPVVIFPGQAPFAQSHAASPPAPAVASEGSTFRRFYSPAAAGQGQPVEMTSSAPAVPAGDADQALRTALASLQRISGAA